MTSLIERVQKEIPAITSVEEVIQEWSGQAGRVIVFRGMQGGDLGWFFFAENNHKLMSVLVTDPIQADLLCKTLEVAAKAFGVTPVAKTG